MTKSLREAMVTDGIPRVVAAQAWAQALAIALGTVHKKTMDYADRSQIYTALDDVPEKVLDALAVSWKIDWYDTAYSTEQKRRIVKSALTVRRLMGTVEAVKLQVGAIYPGTTLEEWFQYDGTPGCFRLNVNLTDESIIPPVVMQSPAAIEENCHCQTVERPPGGGGLLGGNRSGCLRRRIRCHERNIGDMAGIDRKPGGNRWGRNRCPVRYKADY